MADENVTGGDEAAEETPAAEAVEETVAEAPAEEPAAEAAVEEPVAEMPAEEPVAEAPAEEPVAEAPAEAPAAEPEAEQTAAAEPKRKKKRLPRALRPQRSKRTRASSGERKPITRLEKPEHERGRRQERQGTVVSAAMDKTIVVEVDVLKPHPKYKKVVRRSARFHAHDEGNAAKVGDVVRIVETRPLSKQKRWRLAEIVQEAK